MKGNTQEAAAAAAGMCVRTARTWERKGSLPSEAKGPRKWRTRKDPFDGVWDDDVVPLLERDEDGGLQAKTIFEVLEEKHPGRFVAGQLRTLQRRVREWRAVHGPDQEIYFQQEHPPGREGAFDFTHGTELGVTIAGELFVHLLFEFVLSFSGWRWVGIAYGETFEAMIAGIQSAVWELGGTPKVWRSDNLSAATHELVGSGRTLTKRYRDVLDHYGVRGTRIHPGNAHENGIAEKSHDTLKTALDQALRVRGSRDFATVAEYEAFVEGVRAKLNKKAAPLLEEERSSLRPLPPRPVPNYSEYKGLRVSCWSTLNVKGRIYSVPSRLKSHHVDVLVHPDVVEVVYRRNTIETMPRLRGSKTHRIDYRHIIWSLVRKPGAFERYRYREELFPTLAFRRAYDALREWRGERADVEYVRILHLAASTMEATVERALDQLLAGGERFEYVDVKALVAPEQPTVPEVRVGAPDLRVYDGLLAAGGAS